MFNKKTTKRALGSSILALVLCFAMLLGTTYAWFTDSVTSANNIIKSGNLDIELEYWNGTEWVDVAGKSDILTNTLWEPGVTEVAYFRIANAGSLALKYQFGINIVSETAGTNVDGEEFWLSDYIKFGVVEDVNGETDEYANREAAVADVTGAQKISAGYTKATSMKSGDKTYLALVVWMPTTVGNEANYLTSDDANEPDKYRPQIDLGINIFATQYTYEEDSYGKDYDDGAYIPVAPETAEQGEDLVLNGSAESKTTVKVPANVVEALKEAGATGLSVNASAPVVDATNKTVSFTTVELVDQDGNEVDIAATGAKVTVTLPVGNAFANGEQVEVYHDGSFVTYAIVADGKISYEVSHFCEVEVKAAEEVVLDNTIDSVKEFMAFAAAVNAGNSYAGQTVVLGADLDLAGVTWTPIGTSASPFKGTFNGNGKVIKNLSVLMAGKSNVGLFGFTTDGEIKNVTVENAKVAGRLNVGVVAGTPYTTKYTNITVKGHVEVDGMAYVGAVGGKNAYADWTSVTVNVDATSYVNANSVENGTAYRTYVGGVVGFNGEGAHTFKNITTNINVSGSTCDVGGAFGIAHYGNSFKDITVTGNVEIYAAEEADEAEEMGGIAGVWHNETGHGVSFDNCVFTGKLTANVAADLSDNTVTGKAYSATGNGALVIDGEKFVTVYTGDQLKAALAENSNVIFVDNITMAATESNAYGKTGINVKNGQTIDGNGYTLKVTGAGATWDSAISTTGGVIKNLTVAQGFRGIFVNHNSSYSETVVLDNVTIHGPTYTISCDQGMNQNLVATNCTINGWTSYAKTVGEATFTNCSFGKGAGYQFCRPYAPTEFVGCTFSVGYSIDTTRTTVTFDDNCVTAATTTEELINAIKNAPVGEVTTIALTSSVYAGDIKITLEALGKQGGDVVIKAAKGVNPVITGMVTLGYRNQGTGAAMYNANVTFDGITFKQATADTHSINVEDVKSLTLVNCTIINNGEYGITSARGNATGASKIEACTFENAGMQLLGNYATGLVIDGCTFNNSRINVQAGNGVTVQNCKFNGTLTDANVGDSFYMIRSNSTPITVKNCEINVDSTVTGVAANQAKWYLMANRGTTNWTVENVTVTMTDAALAQTSLVVTACTSSGVINVTNLTVNGVQQ